MLTKTVIAKQTIHTFTNGAIEKGTELTCKGYKGKLALLKGQRGNVYVDKSLIEVKKHKGVVYEQA